MRGGEPFRSHMKVFWFHSDYLGKASLAGYIRGLMKIKIMIYHNTVSVVDLQEAEMNTKLIMHYNFM